MRALRIRRVNWRTNDSSSRCQVRAAGVLLDQAHERAAHHHRFRLPRDLRDMLRARDAEAHRQRQIGDGAHALDQRRHGVRDSESRSPVTPVRETR